MARLDDLKNGRADRGSQQVTLEGSIERIKRQILDVDYDMHFVISEMQRYELDQIKQLSMLEGIQRYLHAKRTNLLGIYNFKTRSEWY